MTAEQLYPRQVPMEPRPPSRALPDSAPQIARDGLLHVWDDELPRELCDRLNEMFRSFGWHFDKRATSDATGAKSSFMYARGEMWNAYSGGSPSDETRGAWSDGAELAGAGTATAELLDGDPLLTQLWSHLARLAAAAGAMPEERLRHLRPARVYANLLNVGLDSTPHRAGPT